MLPPYNEHLVRDVGDLYLGLAVVVAWAAVTLDRVAAAAGREILRRERAFLEQHVSFRKASGRPGRSYPQAPQPLVYSFM